MGDFPVHELVGVYLTPSRQQLKVRRWNGEIVSGDGSDAEREHGDGEGVEAAVEYERVRVPRQGSGASEADRH